MLSLGQTRVSLGDRAARRWGWGGPDPAAGDMGLIYAHTARHAGFGQCHHTGKETESLAAQSVIRGLKARVSIIHWWPAGKWFWLQKHHQGGNGKSVRNALPRPAESALHIKIPHSKHLPKVTQLEGRG